jgi:hypothetical protein
MWQRAGGIVDSQAQRALIGTQLRWEWTFIKG